MVFTETLDRELNQLAAICQQYYAVFAEQFKLIQQWRSNRLIQTYQDFYHQAAYQPAVTFLIEDLYGVSDWPELVKQLQRAKHTMVKLLPGGLLQTVIHSVKLASLSVQLDVALAKVLTAKNISQAMLDSINWSGLLRLTRQHAEYQQQVQMLDQISQEISWVINKPMIATGLKMCRKPANLMGLGRLQAYLERGVDAFKKMPDRQKFLQQLKQRETAYLDEVFNDDNR